MSGSLDVAGELDYSQRPVPPSGRMPKLNLTMAFWAICSAMFFLIISATLAEIYGTANTIIGLVLTVISYSAINAVITRYAIRTGLSVSLFSRLLFGRYGSAIATFIYAVSSIYYAVFEGSVIATAATYYFEGLTFAVAALIGTVVYAISHYGYSNAWLTMTPEGGAPPYGWINVFIAFMGVWWMMMCTFDFARFGKKDDETYHAVFNFGLPFYTLTYFVNGLVGIFLVQTIPLEGATSEVSVVKALIVMMGALGLLFVWISQTRINTTNFYLSTVNMQAFFRLVFKLEMPKYVWAVIVGVIVYFVMLANIFQYLLVALAYQGIFVVAWVGVALAYILCGQHDGTGEESARSDDDFPAYYAPGMVAWFGAVAIGIILLAIPNLELLSAPATVTSSFLLFWALSSRTMVAKAAY